MSIVAQSTPIGRSAIAVVRMSGNDCIDIAKKFFSPFPTSPNQIKVGTLSLSDTSDRAMCVYYKSPKSFTGEDMVEFYCHGGIIVPSLVIEKCISLGCRMAENGEFSKIAFINGKENLSTAEGIIELIDAESNLQAKAAKNLLDNKLGKLTTGIQNKLTDLLAQSEAALDYPEEDLEIEVLALFKKELAEVDNQLQELLNTINYGKLAKYGIDVAISGKTNVGKSSLLNALLGNERAIVTDIAGTTRDTVSESINYKDIKINFIDTAGIRKSSGKIEKLGIERSLQAVENADLVLLVTDTDEETEIPDKPCLVIRNKCDLITKRNNDGRIYVSAKNGENIERVKEEIYQKMKIDNINTNSVILTNLRHIDVLKRARNHIDSAQKGIDNTTLDCVTADVKSAWDVLGEITGTTATQDIIDRVFEKFCLGK